MSKTETSSNTWFETLVEAWLIYLTTEEPRWRADAWVSSTTFTIGEPFGWSKVGWRRTYWDSVQLFEFPERKTTSNHGELIGRPANQRAVSSRVDREPLMWLLSRSQALPIRRFCLWAKYIYFFLWVLPAVLRPHPSLAGLVKVLDKFKCNVWYSHSDGSRRF